MKSRHEVRIILFVVAVAAPSSPAWAEIPATDDCPHNSLPVEAVSEDALASNLALRQTLALHPLDSDTIDRLAPPAQVAASTQLLEYIVTCALDGNASIDLAGGQHLDGQLGLCGAFSPYGNWGTASPSPQCLEAVSSCVLALVNARHRRIPVSIRGFEEAQTADRLLGLRPRVLVERQLRELQGNGAPRDIESATVQCAPSVDDSADCGWTALYVGRCEVAPPGAATKLPNASVTLTVRQQGKPVSDVKIRVCKGMYGCDHDMCPPNDPAPHCKYAGFIKSVPAGESQITFPCPDNGPQLTEASDQTSHWYGYYSVMLASTKSQALDRDYDITATPRPASLRYDHHVAYAHYPATEAEVFTYREGAFYGNLFAAVSAPAGVLDTALRLSEAGKATRSERESIYACWADGMMDRFIASMDARWCAGASSCFISGEPQRCHHLPQNPATPWKCGYRGNEERGAFDECSAGVFSPAAMPTFPPYWAHPLTTYLNGPCDLARDDCSLDPSGKTPAGAPSSTPKSARPRSPTP